MLTRVFFFILAPVISVLTACSGNDTPSHSSELPAPLNDTGTSFCRDGDGNTVACSNVVEQDGAGGRDALASAGTLEKVGGGQLGFDWTKLNKAGEPLAQQSGRWQSDGDADSGGQWSCVRDNHTGLLWEVKSDNPEAFNFRDLKYSWYRIDESENGGNAGLENTEDCNGIACNTRAYRNALNKKRLCGSQDWRLPTVNELLTLVVNDNLDLVMDTVYFPNAKNDQYWSRQTYAPRREVAWYLYFSDGSAGSTLKTSQVYTRLVAGGGAR